MSTVHEIMYQSMENFATEAYRRFAEKGDITTLNGKIATLVGNVTGDDAKSVRAISAEEVAKIVADADTDYDTLKEIADWILSDTTGAAKMASDILDLKNKSELGTYIPVGQSDPVQYATVKAYVEAYVASQVGGAALSGSNAIDITNKVVSLIVDSTNANGLSVDTDGLKLALASASTNGALSSSDWSAFNAKQEQVVISDATGSGNAVSAITLGEDGKTISVVKGVDAVEHSEITALTAAECVSIFDTAKTNAATPATEPEEDEGSGS